MKQMLSAVAQNSISKISKMCTACCLQGWCLEFSDRGANVSDEGVKLWLTGYC